MKKTEIKQAQPVLVDLAGKERLFCFNVWAEAEVNDEFGGLAKWGETVNKGDASEKVTAIARMGEILMGGGERWSRFLGETPREVMTEGEITAVLGLDGLRELLKAEFDAILAGQRRTVGAEPPKNADTTPGDM